MLDFILDRIAFERDKTGSNLVWNHDRLVQCLLVAGSFLLVDRRISFERIEDQHYQMKIGGNWCCWPLWLFNNFLHRGRLNTQYPMKRPILPWAHLVPSASFFGRASPLSLSIGRSVARASSPFRRAIVELNESLLDRRLLGRLKILLPRKRHLADQRKLSRIGARTKTKLLRCWSEQTRVCW